MPDKKRTGNSGAKNLIPVTQRSKDEARQISRNGGIKSGKVRREKKLLKESIEMFLSMEYDTAQGKMCGSDAITYAQLQKALRGDTKAFEVLRDTVGQKPVEKVMISDVNADTMAEIDNLVNEEPKKRTTRKKKDAAE